MIIHKTMIDKASQKIIFLFIAFSCNAVTAWRGNWETATDLRGHSDCGFNFNTDSGNMRYPVTGSNYPNNADCSWMIFTSGAIIELTFTRFSTESLSDFVYIRDGEHNLLGKYSGYDLPLSMRTRTNTAVIHFTSDMSINGTGFSLAWKTLDGCPRNSRSFNDYCYYPETEKKSWKDAQTVCKEKYGGELTSIISQDENGFISGFLEDGGYISFNHRISWINGNAWIGLYYNNDLSNWHWSDGKNYALYQNWKRREPNNAKVEHCVEISKGDWLSYRNEKGKWNNLDCNNLNSFICKFTAKAWNHVSKDMEMNRQNGGHDSRKAKPKLPGHPLKAVEVGYNSVTLQWNKPYDAGRYQIEGYKIDYLALNNHKGEWKSTRKTGPNNLKFTVKDLTPEKTYMFRVMTVNNERLSDPIKSDEVKTGPLPYTKCRGYRSYFDNSHILGFDRFGHAQSGKLLSCTILGQRDSHRWCCWNVTNHYFYCCEKNIDKLPMIIGISSAVILAVIMVCIVCCFFCPFCFIYKKRNRGAVHQNFIPPLSPLAEEDKASMDTEMKPLEQPQSCSAQAESNSSPQPAPYPAQASYPTHTNSEDMGDDQPPPYLEKPDDGPPPYSEKQPAFNPNYAE